MWHIQFFAHDVNARCYRTRSRRASTKIQNFGKHGGHGLYNENNGLDSSQKYTRTIIQYDGMIHVRQHGLCQQ